MLPVWRLSHKSRCNPALRRNPGIVFNPDRNERLRYRVDETVEGLRAHALTVRVQAGCRDDDFESFQVFARFETEPFRSLMYGSDWSALDAQLGTFLSPFASQGDNLLRISYQSHNCLVRR